jgi:hypothetical protein
MPGPRAQIELARKVQVFVTFPGMEEFELPGVKSVNHKLSVSDPTEVTVSFLATSETHYGD